MVDSYFGLIGNSFYAGPNGASFKIKQWFHNRKELDNNIRSNRILVGDFLGVSYGLRSGWPEDGSQEPPIGYIGSQFDYNYSQDNPSSQDDPVDNPGDWNATLWQKTTSAGGYTLLVNFQGSPIDIQIETGSHIMPGEDLSQVDYITKDSSSTASNQIFNIHPIDAWDISVTSASISPNTSPSVSSTQNVSTKTITFNLPKAWDISITSASVPPSVSPSVSSSQDNDTKTFAFNLPKAWDIAVAATSAPPGTSPSVSSTENNSTKTFTFNLPRSQVTLYGILFDQNISYTIDDNDSRWSSISNLEVKDIYFNTTEGMIHQVASKTASSITLEYVATVTIPNIIVPYTKAIDKTAWNSSNYSNSSVTFNPPLYCGNEGGTPIIPPIITPNNNTNRGLYDLIVKAEINNTKDTMTFYVSSDSFASISEDDIELTILDHR